MDQLEVKEMRYLGGRLIIGLVLLFLGIGLVLNQFGFEIRVQEIFSYWPVLLLLLGLEWMIRSFRPGPATAERKTAFSAGQFVSGLLLIFIGAFYLARKFGYLEELSPDAFWNLLLALLLIIGGLSLIRSRLQVGSSGGRWAFLGGISVGSSLTPWKLESSSYIAFMGAIEMDLTAAVIPAGETVIDLTAVMGGIDVKIPAGLAVAYEGTAFLGGITFKDQEDGGIIASRRISELNGQTGPALRLRAHVFMGGIEIKEQPQQPLP
ncbi:MAG TPA: cell wall-active antibiotics response protein [Candidatus Moranbacteria bacterium]|nr:cell wall-active antibiotics response protein [Candidatus Moranbacteria bacterium]